MTNGAAFTAAAPVPKDATIAGAHAAAPSRPSVPAGSSRDTGHPAALLNHFPNPHGGTNGAPRGSDRGHAYSMEEERGRREAYEHDRSHGRSPPGRREHGGERDRHNSHRQSREDRDEMHRYRSRGDHEPPPFNYSGRRRASEYPDHDERLRDLPHAGRGRDRSRSRSRDAGRGRGPQGGREADQVRARGYYQQQHSPHASPPPRSPPRYGERVRPSLPQTRPPPAGSPPSPPHPKHRHSAAQPPAHSAAQPPAHGAAQPPAHSAAQPPAHGAAQPPAHSAASHSPPPTKRRAPGGASPAGSPIPAPLPPPHPAAVAVHARGSTPASSVPPPPPAPLHSHPSSSPPPPLPPNASSPEQSPTIEMEIDEADVSEAGEMRHPPLPPSHPHPGTAHPPPLPVTSPQPPGPMRTSVHDKWLAHPHGHAVGLAAVTSASARHSSPKAAAAAHPAAFVSSPPGARNRFGPVVPNGPSAHSGAPPVQPRPPHPPTHAASLQPTLVNSHLHVSERSAQHLNPNLARELEAAAAAAAAAVAARDAAEAAASASAQQRAAAAVAEQQRAAAAAVAERAAMIDAGVALFDVMLDQRMISLSRRYGFGDWPMSSTSRLQELFCSMNWHCANEFDHPDNRISMEGDVDDSRSRPIHIAANNGEGVPPPPLVRSLGAEGEIPSGGDGQGRRPADCPSAHAIPQPNPTPLSPPRHPLLGPHPLLPHPQKPQHKDNAHPPTIVYEMRSPTHRPQDLRCNANVYHLNGGASPNRAALMQATTETVNFTISPSLVRTQAASAPAQPRSPADATPAAGGAKAAAAAASAAVAPPESLRLDVAAATAAAAAAIAASAQLLKAQMDPEHGAWHYMDRERSVMSNEGRSMTELRKMAAAGQLSWGEIILRTSDTLYLPLRPERIPKAALLWGGSDAAPTAPSSSSQPAAAVSMDGGIGPAAASAIQTHSPTSAPQGPSLPLLRPSPGTLATNPGSQPTTETMNADAIIKTELARTVRSTHMRTRSQAAAYNRRTVQAAVGPEDAVMEDVAATAPTAHAGSTLLGTSAGAPASGFGSTFGVGGASAAAGRGAGATASPADQGAGATACFGAEVAAVSAQIQGVRQTDRQVSLAVPGAAVGRSRAELPGLSAREAGKQVANPCVWGGKFSARLCRPVREIDHLRSIGAAPPATQARVTTHAIAAAAAVGSSSKAKPGPWGPPPPPQLGAAFSYSVYRELTQRHLLNLAHAMVEGVFKGHAPALCAVFEGRQRQRRLDDAASAAKRVREEAQQVRRLSAQQLQAGREAEAEVEAGEISEQGALQDAQHDARVQQQQQHHAQTQRQHSQAQRTQSQHQQTQSQAAVARKHTRRHRSRSSDPSPDAFSVK
ncbi:MAG: hypothetical protein WDW36_006999 [Sanguina aurantia]